MPGTIQVSVSPVLDLVGFSSSSIFVKISMGKKEYQTWDKGDFSFPLTALRDNLIVTLHDAEGNELCRKGVETRLIVEKGVLDDLLSPEGGGHLHIKFQFILTEEDRKRIREMRESALRRKHGELLTSSIRHSRSMPSLAIHGGDIVSSSISFNNEVTDSHRRADQMEAVSVSGETPLVRSISNLGNREGIHVGQLVQTSPNDTDGSESNSSATPLAQELKFHLTKANQRNATHIPARPVSSKEDLDPRFGGLSSVVEKYGSVSNTLDKDQAYCYEKQSALEKTPSNVKSMINAFESGLYSGPRPRDNESKTKFPSKNNNKELKMEKTNTIQSNADTGLKPSSKGTNSNERVNSRIKHRKEEIILEESSGPSLATTDAKTKFPSKNNNKELKMEKTNTIQSNADTGLKPSSKGTNSNERVNSRIKHRKEEIILEESSGPSLATTDANLRRINDGPVSTDRSQTTHEGEQDSGLNVLVESKWKTCTEDSSELYPENENHPFESSGNCIFSDDTRHLCITTGSKKVMDLVKACDNYGKNNRTETRSSKAEQKLNCYTRAEVKKNGKGSHSSKKQKLESSKDDNFPGGIIGQAVRIAIMVAFGTLVLVTRQRINR